MTDQDFDFSKFADEDEERLAEIHAVRHGTEEADNEFLTERKECGIDGMLDDIKYANADMRSRPGFAAMCADPDSDAGSDDGTDSNCSYDDHDKFRTFNTAGRATAANLAAVAECMVRERRRLMMQHNKEAKLGPVDEDLNGHLAKINAWVYCDRSKELLIDINQYAHTVPARFERGQLRDPAIEYPRPVGPGHDTRFEKLPASLSSDDCPLLRRDPTGSDFKKIRAISNLYECDEAIPGVFCKADDGEIAHYFSAEPRDIFNLIQSMPPAVHWDELIRGKLPFRFFIDIDCSDDLGAEKADEMLNEIVAAAAALFQTTFGDKAKETGVELCTDCGVCTSHDPLKPKWSFHVIFEKLTVRNYMEFKYLTEQLIADVPPHFSCYVDPLAATLKGLRLPWSCKKPKEGGSVSDATREMTPAFQIIDGVRHPYQIVRGAPADAKCDYNIGVFETLLVQPPGLPQNMEGLEALFGELYFGMSFRIDPPGYNRLDKVSFNLSAMKTAVEMIQRTFPSSPYRDAARHGFWSIFSAGNDTCPIHERVHMHNNGYANISRNGSSVVYHCHSHGPSPSGRDFAILGTFVGAAAPDSKVLGSKCIDPEAFHICQSRAMEADLTPRWGHFLKASHFYQEPSTKIIDDGRRVRFTIAPLMTGKSTAERKVIADMPAGTRIVWVSYRRSLTLDTMKTLGDLGFQSYNDKNARRRTGSSTHIDLFQDPRWVIQLESLHLLLDPNVEREDNLETSAALFLRGIEEIEAIDLLVIDETNSVLRQAGPTVPSNEKFESIRVLLHLLKTAKAVHCMDGLLSQDIVQELHSLTTQRSMTSKWVGDKADLDSLPSLQVNQIQNMGNKHATFHQNRFTIREVMLDYAAKLLLMPERDQQANKFFIACGSCRGRSTPAEGFNRYLIEKLGYRQDQIQLIVGITDDQTKQDVFADVGESWGNGTNILVVIYTVSLEAGVSFEERDVFQRGFVFADNAEIHVEQFIQMMFRIRDCHRFDLYVEISPASTALSIKEVHKDLQTSSLVAQKQLKRMLTNVGGAETLRPTGRLALLNRARLNQSKARALSTLVWRFKSWGINIHFRTLLAVFADARSFEPPISVLDSAEFADESDFQDGLEMIKEHPADWDNFIKMVKLTNAQFLAAKRARESHARRVADHPGTLDETMRAGRIQSTGEKCAIINYDVGSTVGASGHDLFNHNLVGLAGSEVSQAKVRRLETAIKLGDRFDTEMERLGHGELTDEGNERLAERGAAINVRHFPVKQTIMRSWLRAIGFAGFDGYADATDMSKLLIAKHAELTGLLGKMVDMWKMAKPVGAQAVAHKLFADKIQLCPKQLRSFFAYVNPNLYDVWNIRIIVRVTDLKIRPGIDPVTETTNGRHSQKRWGVHVAGEFLRWSYQDPESRQNVSEACYQSTVIQRNLARKVWEAMEGKTSADIPTVLDDVFDGFQNPNDITTQVEHKVAELRNVLAASSSGDAAMLQSAKDEYNKMTAYERKRKVKATQNLLSKIEMLQAHISQMPNLPDVDDVAAHRELLSRLSHLQQQQAKHSNDVTEMISKIVTDAQKRSEHIDPREAAAYATAVGFAELSTWIADGATTLNVSELVTGTIPEPDTEAIRKAHCAIRIKQISGQIAAGDDAGLVAWLGWLLDPPKYKSGADR
jgi:hypothetical protein